MLVAWPLQLAAQESRSAAGGAAAAEELLYWLWLQGKVCSDIPDLDSDSPVNLNRLGYRRVNLKTF